MAIEWRDGPGGDDASRVGFDDGGFLVVEVVRYRDTEMVVGADGVRRPVGGVPYWVALAAHERVEGRHATAEEAMAAAEAHHEAASSA